MSASERVIFFRKFSRLQKLRSGDTPDRRAQLVVSGCEIHFSLRGLISSSSVRSCRTSSSSLATRLTRVSPSAV